MSQPFAITNFAGGMSNRSPERLTGNMLSYLKNMFCIEGSLQSIPGRMKYNATEILANKGVMSVGWLSTGGKTYKVAKCGTYVWLEVTTNDWRPIKGGLTEGTKTSFARYGNRLYFADQGVFRWDGFYDTAKATCAGDTGVVALGEIGEGDTANWKPGDKFFLKVAGAYGSQYEIKTIDSGTQITLTTNGPACTAVPCIVARTHNAGIAAPSITPTLSAETGSSGLDHPAAYQYKWAFYEYATGKENVTASPVATESTVNAGDSVMVKLMVSPPFINTKYGLRIYRTEGGGSTFKKLVDIVVPAGLMQGPYYYADLIADGALGALFSARTTDATIPDGRNVKPILWTVSNEVPIRPGTYKYVFTLWNSVAKVESNPCAESTGITTTTGQYPRVSLYGMTSCDRQTDYIRIYRTSSGGVVYKRVDQVPWPAGASAMTYDDTTVTDDLLGVGVDPYHDPPPSTVCNVTAINDHLFAAGDTAQPEYLLFSATGNVEYFSDLELGKDDATAFTYPTIGGKVKMGATGEPVTAVMPMGVVSSDPTHASYVLVLTRTGTKELWGNDWTDFSRKEGTGEGCVGAGAIANCAGQVAWITPNGPVMMRPGGAVPTPMYRDLFPQISCPFSAQVTAGAGVNDYFSLCSAAYWRDFFVMTWPQSSSTVANRMAIIHVPTGAVSMIGDASNVIKSTCLCVLAGPQDNGELLMGDPDKGTIWKMFAWNGTNTYWDGVSAGVPIEFKYPITDPKEGKPIKMDRVHVTFRKPTADQTVRFYVRSNAGTTPTGDTGSKTLDVSEEASERIGADYQIAGTGRLVEVGMEATVTVPVTVERLIPSIDTHTR